MTLYWGFVILLREDHISRYLNIKSQLNLQEGGRPDFGFCRIVLISLHILLMFYTVHCLILM